MANLDNVIKIKKGKRFQEGNIYFKKQYEEY